MTCHNCRTECRKAGKRPDGMQRYRCGQCGNTFSDRVPMGWTGHKQAVDDDTAMLALTLLVEGNSIRSVQRITGLEKRTVIRMLVIAGQKCEALMDRHIRNVPVRDVQADEIWSYVGKKEGHKAHGDTYRVGDAWTFIAIERHTKIVLAFEVGKRTITSATRFITKLATATDDTRKFQLTTDGLNAYPFPVGNILGDRVHYAQLVKIYQQDSPEAVRRYSPAKFAEAHRTPVYGEPEESQICTSHIERQNGSLRQWCKRLTRLTYAFSKKWEHHRAALALHFAYYNFCRIHRSIKMTPAMAAGVAVGPWTIRELLA